MAISVEHPLFQLIRSEHEQIRQLIRSITNTMTKLEMLNITNKLISYAEEHHHYQEEMVVFKKVEDHPRLSEGGPLCIFFYDHYLASNPIQTIENLYNLTIEIKAHQQSFYDKKLPLQVPVDEHRAGSAILSYIQNNAEAMDSSKIYEALSTYSQLQLHHLEKEENCFFHLCAILLNEKEADAAITSWKPYCA